MKIVNKEGYLTKKAAFVLQYMLSNDKILNKIELKDGRCISVGYAKELLDELLYDDHMKCMNEGKDCYSFVGLEDINDIGAFKSLYRHFFKDTHQENGQFTEEAAKIVFDMVIGGAVSGGLRCRNNNEIHDILGTKQVKSKYPYRINGFAYSPTLGFYVNETAQSDIVGFVTKADRKEFKRRWLNYCIAEYEKAHQRQEANKSEYPKPVNTILENGTKYDYIWWAARGFKVSSSVWNGKPEHMKRLSSRRIFGSKEEAVKAATYLNTIMENV